MLIDKETAKKILDPNLDKDGKFLFENSEKLASEISGKINSTQLRKYFDEVKKISNDEEKFKFEIRRFLALIMYKVYKIIDNEKKYEKKAALEDFSKSIKNMVDVVTEGDLRNLERFKNFFEAVVAYYYKCENEKKQKNVRRMKK